MSLLFNMLSRLVIAFLPRSKHLLISWLQSPSAVILGSSFLPFLVALGVELGYLFDFSPISWGRLVLLWTFPFSSVQVSHSVVSNSLRPQELKHARPHCPSSTPGVHPNPCPLSQWCHPTTSSSIVPFSSWPKSFPESGSFPMSQFFASDAQSIGVSASASVLTMNIQDWFPLGLTSLIFLQSKGLSRVFSSTTIQKHHFFSAQLSLRLNSHIHTWLREKP